MKGLILPFKIGERGLMEDTPDEEYRFRADISDKSLDALYSRMSDSTLNNFVEDANRHVSFMDSHKTDLMRCIGYVAGAERSGDLVSATIAMLRDASDTPPHLSINEHIRRVEKGVYNDVSVGFFGGREICDLCKRGLWEYNPDGKNCKHYPGEMYKDEGGICTYEVNDARLGEVSLVTVGANPNAQITQRSALADKALIDFKSNRAPEKESEPSLLEQAGKKYRDSIIDEALNQGVRADGANFDRFAWQKRLDAQDVESILELTRMWQDRGDEKFGKGRSSTDPNSGGGEAKTLLPSILYL